MSLFDIVNQSRLYREPQEGYQDLALNFVFPAGQAPLMGLREVNFDKISARTCAPQPVTESGTLTISGKLPPRWTIGSGGSES
jgi:hypothetical protein